MPDTFPGAPLAACVLDAMRQALLVVDGERRILLRNAAASRMIGRGHPLRDEGGYLNAAAPELDEGLQRALARVCASRAVECVLPLAQAGGALAHLRPIAQPNCALLALFEADVLNTDIAQLAAAFGLTPAEARVAHHLCQGLSAMDIARECRVAISTVRSQLQSLFGKTGTHRQPDLVRLLLIAGAV